jgi:hypothetical protein
MAEQVKLTQRAKTFRGVVVSMLGIFCVGQCSSGVLAADRELQPAINACDFLTVTELTAIVSAKVERGVRDDSGAVDSGDYAVAGTYSSTCLWRFSRGRSRTADPNLSFGQESYVILNVMQWPSGSGQARRFLDSFRDAAKRGEIPQSPVPVKIADEALWWGDGVALYKEDKSAGVSVHLVGGRERERGMEEALARMVASRL